MKSIVAFLALLPVLASASPVAVSFDATVDSMYYATCISGNGSCSSWTFDHLTSSNAYEGKTISVGDSFTSAFTYDTSAPITAVSADGYQGIYLNAFPSATLESSNLILPPDQFTSGSISIVDGRGFDQFFTQQVYFDSQWASIVTTDLLDASETMYTGFGLPQSVDLQDFNANIFQLAFVNLANGDQLQVSGHFNQFSGASAVPEPTGLSLVSLALVLGMVALRRQIAANRTTQTSMPNVA